MFERVVAGFENSEPGRAALKEAALLAQKWKGEIFLVHGIPFNREEFSLAPDLQEKRLQEASRFCEEAGEEVRKQFSISPQIVIGEGDPHEVILKTAKERDAQLITLGAFGPDGIRHLLLGSVTSRVILDAHCNVLVVKKSCDQCTGEFHKILVPYDGSSFSSTALRQACEMIQKYDGSVEVLYVIPHYEEMIEFFKTEHMKEHLRREAERLLEKAVEEAQPYGVTLHAHIRDGHSAEEIILAARESSADLILMGTHGWKGFSKAIMGSTTRRVITHTEIPVLVAR